jgi:acetylornithine deacetylase/succinyl-diaminopimelate desuccinylase-like protein
MFGGSLHNPAQVLCELIAGMHDSDGRVTLPGFYDKVRPLTAETRSDMAWIPYSDEEWLTLTGAPALHGESGYTTLERVGARPTLEVNGLVSGYTGDGPKTVLPASALAKISLRLVPDQDPVTVEEQLRAYLERNAPPTVRWETRTLASTLPVVMRRSGPWTKAAVSALKDTFGREPLFTLEGGSIPAVSVLGSALGAASVLMGYSLPDDNIHSPNERFYVPNLQRGVEAYVRFFENVGCGDGG